MPQFTGTSNDDVLTGTPDIDTIDGGLGRDTISGGAGSDSLTGGPGGDLISGDDGADTVADTEGANTLHGGAGDDVISGFGLIFAEDGDDTVASTLGHITVVGGLGNDWITGTGELYGGAGDDTIGAAAGSILGGEAGDDNLAGQNFSTLVGEDGADTLVGNHGTTLIGGNGDDRISNLDGGSVSAGAGADTVLLIGGYYLPSPRFPSPPVAPVDVDLGDGDDTAYLSSFDGGVVRGGAGDDVFYQTSQSHLPVSLTVVMDGGRDQLITATSSGAVTVQGFSAGGGGDVIHYATFTTPFPDHLTDPPPALTEQFTSDPFAAGYLRVVQSGADVIVQWDPDAGVDNFFLDLVTLKDVTRGALTAENFGGWNPLALERVDTPFVLHLQSSWDGFTNPFLTGHLALVEEGADTLLLMDRDGGANETILLARYIDTPASAITADLLGGVGPIVAAPGRATDDVIRPVDTGYELHLFGGDGDDSVAGLGRADTIGGGSGADTLLAGGGEDSVAGGTGDDSLSGDAGSDTLTGGAGADTFRLSSGSEMDWVRDFNGAEGDRVAVAGQSWIAYQFGGDVVVDVPGGRMMLQNTQLSSLPSGWIFGLDTPPSSQTGTAAAEVLIGGSGGDTLIGGGGDDSIAGGGGADSLSGDSGADTLTGGAGADVFRLGGGSDMDWVQDFNAGEGDRVMVAAGHTYVAYQFGSYVVVDTDGGRMMLQNTQLSSLPSGWIFSG